MDCSAPSTGRMSAFPPTMDIKPGSLESLSQPQHQVLNVPLNTEPPVAKPQQQGELAQYVSIWVIFLFDILVHRINFTMSLGCTTSPFALPTPPFSSNTSTGSPAAIGSPISSSGASAASPSAYFSEDNADSCGEQAMDHESSPMEGGRPSDLVAASSALDPQSQQQSLVSLIPQPSPMDGYLVRYRDLDNWCSLHYYELQHRVGDTFHVRVNSVSHSFVTDYVDKWSIRDLF